MMENTFINIKNKSFSITSDIVVPKGGTNGVILTQGGRFGGWSMYLKKGKSEFTYNYLGIKIIVVSSYKKLPEGESNVKVDFAYDGGGLGKGGELTISVNGEAVGKGCIEKTQPRFCIFFLKNM